MLPGVLDFVIRRVGGLEETHRKTSEGFQVIRRVGGLEVKRTGRQGGLRVIRRVGGLEGRRGPCRWQ